MIDLIGKVGSLQERQVDMLGDATIGRAVTATLHVSPNGTGIDGLSWRTAFTTIQAALDAASTDADNCTLILISPHASNYDIYTTGDPTWAANVILKGTHRNWAKIKNTHDDATSILKLTGKAALIDLNFNLHTGSANGVILTHGGARVYCCMFVGESLGGAAVALHLDHATGGKHAKVMDCDFLGHTTRMTAILIDQYGRSNFERLRIHDCLTGIQIIGANSNANIFNMIDIGECAIAFDLDVGSEQHFYELMMHHNTKNVDDEVADHLWANIHGALPIRILPNNLVGINVATGGMGAYGGDTEIIAAAAIDNPFRIVGVHFEPDAAPPEWYQVRFSADSGGSWYDVIQFQGVKREGTAAPSGTEFIFNTGTRISCSARDVSGGDNVLVWVEVQDI